MTLDTLLADPAAIRLDHIRPSASAVKLVVKTIASNKEFVGFARGISEDYEAVRNALTYEWSNGQLEGQVNRLKAEKRGAHGSRVIKREDLLAYNKKY